MKTLFGERKSVKTLAFILALALILPLLPVMSVGAEVSSVMITFGGIHQNWRENGVDFTDVTQDAYVSDWANASSHQNLEWKNNSSENSKANMDNLTATWSNNDNKVTLSGITISSRIKSFSFRVDPISFAEGSYAIYFKDGTNEEKVMEPSADGVYTINLTSLEHGNVTIEAKQTKTVTFPNASEMAGKFSLNSTAEFNGTYLSGKTTTTSTENYTFYIKPVDTTTVPVVYAIDSNGAPMTDPKVEFASGSGVYKCTISSLTSNCTLIIELREALTISYQAAPGTATNSFTIEKADDGKNDLYSAPYNTKSFKFTVKATDGYDLEDVTLNGESIVEQDSKENQKVKVCAIDEAITKNITIYVTTTAVKPKVQLQTNPPTGEQKTYTVSGIVFGTPIPVSYGGSFTFSVKPEPGYNNLIVKYKMGQAVEKQITPDGNSYTINGITEDVTIIIEAGALDTFKAELVHNGHLSKGVIDEKDVWEDNKFIKYNSSHEFKVKPDAGYKVTAITAKSGNDVLTSSVNSNSIYVSNITSDLRIEVTTEPITITVKINDAGELNGSYAFKYGESGFNTGWIKWDQTEQGKIFDSERIDELLKQIGELSGKNANPTRFGFDFDTTKGTKGWIIADESLKVNPNADTTITLTATWKPDFTELFVLKTSVKYDNALKTLSFTSTLAVNDLADDEAKKTYTEVKVSRFGIFYGENTSTLSGDPTTITTAREIIGNGSTTYSDGDSVTAKFFGSDNSDNRIFFYIKNPANPVDFLVSGSINGNTITENFKEPVNKSRSAITWIEIKLDDGTTAVIVGPATSYNA